MNISISSPGDARDGPLPVINFPILGSEVSCSVKSALSLGRVRLWNLDLYLFLVTALSSFA